MSSQPQNPLYQVKLQKILEDLVQQYGWENLAQQVKIRCFIYNPSICSSLQFLRKTKWAREKVENIWIQNKNFKMRQSVDNKEVLSAP